MSTKFALISQLFVLLNLGYCLQNPNNGSSSKSVSKIEPTQANLDGEGYRLPMEGICGPKVIRGRPKSFELLKNCSVIVGPLFINMMEWAKESDFARYTFPELREVTDYIIVYKVEGLTSLGDLFPNLMLIRGRTLFMNYALTIYQMPSLQDIGLKSLVNIQRGFVRIESNPRLCYVDTIDWHLITGKKGNYLKRNGNAMCPGRATCRGCDNNYCWKTNIPRYCQKNIIGSCHKECLGGCRKNGNCYRCANFLELDKCVPNCSKGRFEFKEASLCVTKEMCTKKFEGWIWQNECITACPHGYQKVETGNNIQTCEKCNGSCAMVCYGSEINTIAETQFYRGCKTINGSLQIRLHMNTTDDLMKELEENLGSIEEITGFLKIYRSMPITTLSFFKNLSIIRGEDLEYERYSLIVYEMDNLQNLWNWTDGKKLKIGNGTIFFHYNSKLCLREIELFKNMTGLTANEHDVSTESNGFKVGCHLITLKTESLVIDTQTAEVTFQRHLPGDPNNNIQGYFVYYLQNPEEDITEEYGRDACFENGWKYVYIADPKEANPPSLTVLLTDLNAFTEYAFYVETYNTAKGTYISQSGKSVIQTFKTEMDSPSMPLNLQTISNSSDSLTLHWKDDPEYTGVITRYIVELYIQLDDKEILDTRNYCQYPLEKTPEKKIEINSTEEYDNERQCDCDSKDTFEKLIESNTTEFRGIDDYNICTKYANGEADISEMSAFDALKYAKCSALKYNIDDEDEKNEKERKKRNLNINMRNDDHLNPKDFSASPTPRPPLQNVTRNQKYHFFSTDIKAPNKNYTLRNLRHFSRYLIYFGACKGDKNSDCGVVSMKVQRTMKDPKADDISNMEVRVLNKSSVEVLWKEPSNPNGLIVSYTLQYKKIGITNFKPVSICIPRIEHEKNGFVYLLKNLLSGEYSVRIKATSLAGDTNFTAPIIFDIREPSIGFDWIIFWSISAICLLIIPFIVYWVKKSSINIRRRNFNVLHTRFLNDDEDNPIEFSDPFLN